MNVYTEEHTLKFFESCDDGMHFLFHCCIVLRRLCQLLQEVGNWSSFLYDTCA
jgi:hypothetical protein